MNSLILKFTFTALLIELTPGPNMAYLAALTLAEGKRVGLAAVAGIFLGLATIGVLTAFGLATLIEQIPLLYSILRYAGCFFLLFLAWEGWQRAAQKSEQKANLKNVFFRGLMTNLLNPKSALFYVSVLPLFLIEKNMSVSTQTFILASIYVAIATIIHIFIVLFADHLRPYLVSGSRELIVRRALSVSLALVAIWFFIETKN
jgi:threonine/homoserine/homoserine lactone efflux protein